MNILFSTTRQWNPGDEFILHGIKRLFSKLDLRYNAVIYNRHPSITPRRNTLKHRWSKVTPVPHYDNSFIPGKDQKIDYVVFAGTPEWYGGKRMDILHRYIADHKIRCAFIGNGLPKEPQFSDTLRFIFSNLTDVFIARDENCYKAIQKLTNAWYLPCPALFSAPKPRLRTNSGRTGIVIQDTQTSHHNIPGALAGKLLQEFEKVEKQYNVTYIAHYIDDLAYADSLKKKVFYTAFSEDFHTLFDPFDFIISTRVHGCGMASSLGIPNILIPHDGRSGTADKFLSRIYEPSRPLIDQIQEIDIPSISQQLLEHRDVSEQEYLSLLKKTLSIL